MSIQDLYRSAVIEHNRNPRNFYEMSAATHHSRGLNALCGDDIRVFLRVVDQRIEVLSFIGQASAITMASASLMTEILAASAVEQALLTAASLDRLLDAPEVNSQIRRDAGELIALEGVRQYPSRVKSARLPWQTLRAALAGDPIASTQ